MQNHTHDVNIESGLERGVIKQIIGQLAQRVAKEWRDRGVAQARGGIKAAYEAVLVTEVSENGFTVSMRNSEMPSPLDALGLMYETGFGPGGFDVTSPWDLRMFLLRGGKTAVNVPFSKSQSTIESISPRAAAMLPSLRPGAPDMGSTAGAKRMPSGMSGKLMEHHVTDATAQLIRINNPGSVDSFRLWRRASIFGKPWIRSGITPLKIAENLCKEIPQMFLDVAAEGK